MKKILTVFILFLAVNGYGQKIAAYKYGEVDTVLQFQDAQIIIYNDKKGSHKADTIYHSKQKKEIVIDWAHVVITDSRYLKTRSKFKKRKDKFNNLNH